MPEVDVPAPGGQFAGATTDRGRTPGGRFNGDGISGFVAQVLEDSILWIGINPPTSDQYILWINTEDGRWYGKWNDGDSTQWVDMSLPFGEGVPGPQGPRGERGLQGATGQGIPTGGTADQILVKLDGTDYNTYWGDRPADGLNVLNGTSDPVDVSDGVNGEFFINTTTWDIFGPKASGSWPAGVSLIGPTGDTGPQGETVLNGTVDPTTEGEDGDFYINTTDWKIFGPKAAGVWPTGASLKGVGSYDLRFGFNTSPNADQVIDTIPITRTVDFDADFANSVGTVGTNPTASYDMDIQKNGVSIGTCNVTTGGVVSFTTVSNTAKQAVNGDIITFVAPSTPDATIATFVATLYGTVPQ